MKNRICIQYIRERNMLNGLNFISIELSKICKKECFMCGRRKMPKEYQDKHYNKHIDLDLLHKIKRQVPQGIITSFHIDGEPTEHPQLEQCLKMFEGNIRVLDTNGQNLIKKSQEIINNLETITISTFQDDPEWERQWYNLQEFLKIKGNKKPNVIIRCLGDIDPTRMILYKTSDLLIAKRILHSSKGSFNYTKDTIIPEIGICLEVLSKLAIDVEGNVRPCVRFDPYNEFVIGNINNQTLEQIWNGKERKDLLQKHISGKRNEINFCKKCDYWGCPNG